MRKEVSLKDSKCEFLLWHVLYTTTCLFVYFRSLFENMRSKADKRIKETQDVHPNVNKEMVPLIPTEIHPCCPYLFKFLPDFPLLESTATRCMQERSVRRLSIIYSSYKEAKSQNLL